MPGTTCQLVQDVMVKLSASNDPTLQPSKVAAVSLFSAQQQQDSRAGMGGRRTVPDLGPLGEFLLGRWQEEAAQERALLARSMAGGAM